MRRIRIGFHGVPGAGKTVLHAMFYGFRDVDGGSLLFTDATTIEYLRPRWEQICGRRTPSASAMGKPDRLLWNFKTTLGEWEIEALDFAGVLIEPIADSDVIANRLADEVHSFLSGCDGLFLLVDASNPDQRQLDALAVLLKNLRDRRRSKKNWTSMPVALLLTKFDRLGPIDAEPAANQTRAMELLGEHPILKPVGDFIDCERKGAWWYRIFPSSVFSNVRIQYNRVAAGEWYRVFPVSAFGKPCKEGTVPPREQLRPYNLHEPLRWLVEQYETELTRSRLVRRRRRLRNWLIAVAAIAVVLLATLVYFWEWNDRTWVQATAADVPALTDYQTVRNLYRAWLRIPGTGAARQGRANAAINRLEDAWDRLQYAKISKGASAASNWEQFAAATVDAKAYVDADRTIKRMSAPVNQLLQWEDGIRSGRVGWQVRVAAAPYPHDLAIRLQGLRDHGISFVLDFNGQTGDTRWNFVESAGAATNYDCGLFPISWGESLGVHAKLTVYNKSGDSAAGDFGFTPSIGPPERYVLGVKLSGTGDPVVILELQCKGLAPPPLPPYGK